MSLTHFDPFANLPATFLTFENALNRLWSEPVVGRPWAPAVDIAETEDEIVVKADIPDVKLEDIDVRVENHTLTVKGERKFEKEDKAKGYHRIERSYGTFLRSFTMPSEVEPDKISADYSKGVLTVKLPKKESAKPRQVKVSLQN